MPFLLIIFEVFLQLDLSPPVVNSMDWTWFGKAHTCLYKVSQLTVLIRATTEPWGQRTCQQSSETGYCWGTDLGKATKKFLLRQKVPKSTAASIIPKWKTFEATRTPTAGQPAKLINQRTRALVREVTKRPDRSLSLGKDSWKPALGLQKTCT